jgi:hypothetical protein
MQYILMHKENPVLEMELDEITGGIIALGKLYDPARLPVGITMDSADAGRAGINHWWLSRSIPASRSGIRDALERLGCASTKILLSKCFGLSLSDQYWVRPENRELCWADINFFDNSFSEDVGNILFGADPVAGAIDLVSPDNTSDGMLKKRWKIIEGERCLIKGGSAPFYQEPLNEVFASKLMERLGIDHVPYSLLWIDSLPYSVCPDFITANTELVSAHHIRNTLPLEQGETKYRHFMKCCKALGIPGMEVRIGQMLALDFLIANEDRHMGNFGAIRDADTLEWIGPAPIFDCGTSLWHDHLFRWAGPEADCPSKPFAETHSEQIKLASSLDWLDFAALKEAAADLDQILAFAPRFMDDGRIETISNAFEARADALREIVLEIGMQGPEQTMI